jgi:hypothetical protein
LRPCFLSTESILHNQRHQTLVKSAMTLSSLVDWVTKKKLRQISAFQLTLLSLSLSLSVMVMIPRGSSLAIARRFARRAELLRSPAPSFYHGLRYSSFHRPLSSQARGNYFDSWEDDSQGFGAFDYVPDEYDSQDMNSDNNFDVDVDVDVYVSGEDEYDGNVNVGAGWEEPNTAWNQRKRQSPSPSPWKMTSPVNVAKRETQTTKADLEQTSNSIQPQEAPPTAVVATVPTKTTASASAAATETDSRLSRASKGIGMSTELDAMEEQLQRILQKIAVEASKYNYPTLNPNSPRQVSEALFGIEGESTSKDVLEALASSKSNKKHLADLILQFRQLARDIGTRKKRLENKEKGILAKSVHTVKRSSQTTTLATSSPSTQEKDHEETITPKQTDAKAWPTRTPEDPLLLVDASAFIYRA